MTDIGIRNGPVSRWPNIVPDQDITMGIIRLLDRPVCFLVARDKHRHTNAHFIRHRIYECQEIEVIGCLPWKYGKKQRKRQPPEEGRQTVINWALT